MQIYIEWLISTNGMIRTGQYLAPSLRLDRWDRALESKWPQGAASARTKQWITEIKLYLSDCFTAGTFESTTHSRLCARLQILSDATQVNASPYLSPASVCVRVAQRAEPVTWSPCFLISAGADTAVYSKSVISSVWESRHRKFCIVYP